MNKSLKINHHLTSLSKPIIRKILSFLPLRSAIAFCMLSKELKFLWKGIPSLLLECESSENDEHIRFAEFIDRALDMHDCGVVERFSVKINYQFSLEDNVERWIQFALKHTVQDLNLQFALLPPTIANLGDWCFLKKLTLCLVKLRHVGDISWTWLEMLYLERITSIKSDMMESMLKGSPVLNSLTLKSCLFDVEHGAFRINGSHSRLEKLVIGGCYVNQVRSQIEIIGPHLLSLSVVDFVNCKAGLKLVNVKSLLEAEIDFWFLQRSQHIRRSDSGKDKLKETLKELLQNLLYVKKIRAGANFIQNLPGSHLERVLLGNSCEILKADINISNECFNGMGNLLRSCSNLEQLIVNIMPTEGGFNDSVVLLQICDWRLGASDSLRRIELTGCIESASEKIILGFVEFFLKNAKVLQKFIIQATNCGSLEAKEKLDEIVRKLNFYKTTSPECQLFFHIA